MTDETAASMNAVNYLKDTCYAIAEDHGWWDDTSPRSDLELFMLMVTEIAEATEAARSPAGPLTASLHIPAFTAVEEEMADVIIRVLDYCGGRNLDIAGALMAKILFNDNRPHRHGGKRF